jgi:hypothetical protein
MDDVYVHYIVEKMEDVDWDFNGALKKAKELVGELKSDIKVYKCVGVFKYHAPSWHKTSE